MANIFENNFFNLGVNLIPWFWRKTKTGGENPLVALVRSVLKPLQTLVDSLDTFQQTITTRLSYTGQHLSLEAYLNDNYDNDLRRIFITENNIPVQILDIDLYLSGEVDPSEISIYLSGESALQDFSLYLSGELPEIFPFTINIPSAIIFDESVVRGQLSRYIISGSNYNILTF
jgi:hypothetical protein